MFNFNEPLGMPQGSVRAVLTILSVVGAVVLHIIKQPSVELDGLALAALGSYFGYRVAKTGAPELPPSEPLPAPMTIDPNAVDGEVDRSTLVPGSPE